MDPELIDSSLIEIFMFRNRDLVMYAPILNLSCCYCTAAYYSAREAVSGKAEDQRMKTIAYFPHRVQALKRIVTFGHLPEI